MFYYDENGTKSNKIINQNQKRSPIVVITIIE